MCYKGAGNLSRDAFCLAYWFTRLPVTPGIAMPRNEPLYFASDLRLCDTAPAGKGPHLRLTFNPNLDPNKLLQPPVSPTVTRAFSLH
jgi:hypothetical protein